MMSRSAWITVCSRSRPRFWTSRIRLVRRMTRPVSSKGNRFPYMKILEIFIDCVRLFYGKKRQRLTDLGPGTDRRHQSSIHEKEDLFSHLHVNVSEEGYDLYDGLSRYFDDVVEFEGVKKRMDVSLIDLPPILHIQLQRAQFDRETQQAYKSQAYVKFGETLYLDRFLDGADPEKKTRSKAIQAELNACRDRIQKFTQGKVSPIIRDETGV